MSRPLISRTKPDALRGLLQVDHAMDLSSQHPTIHDANFLWERFLRNANPLIKIDFDWALETLRSTSTTSERRAQLKDEEHAFVFCVFLMSVVSLPQQECVRYLGQLKEDLLSHYQAICEQALSRTNIFCITNTIVIRAILLYIVSFTIPLSQRHANTFPDCFHREIKYTELVLTNGFDDAQRREVRNTS
jgi:hypothetical protein